MLKEGLIEITAKGMGMTAVVNSTGRLVGVFTDGDLRRALDKTVDIHTTLIRDVMTPNCKTVRENVLAAEVVHVMETEKINGLLVLDDNDNLVGALNVHDLFHAGIM